MMTIKDVREEIKAQNLDIFGVCEWLEKYGSDGDPIFYRGKETTPTDLAYHLAQYTPALDVRISFYGTTKTSSCGLRRNSNFAHMIKDRIDMFADRRRATAKEERKPFVKYLVTWKEWQGIEPCGKAEWLSRCKEFERRTEAKAFFIDIKRKHSYVKFRKVTDELLGESED